MRRKRIGQSLIAIVLSTMVFLPSTSVYAYKVGDIGVFGDNNADSSQTGESNTETDINTGGSDTATDSTAALENKESVNQIINWFENIPGTGGNFYEIESTNGITLGENFTFSKDQLSDLLSHANFTAGEKYNSPASSASSSYAATDQDKAVLREVLTGTLDGNNIQEDDIVVSGSGNNFSVNFNDVTLAGSWPGTDGLGLSGDSLTSYLQWLTEHGGTQTTIDGGKNIFDFGSLSERYEALTEYLNNTAITDTVAVQHILEFKINGTTTSTKYIDGLLPYSSGGYYRWDVDVTDMNGNYVGGMSDLKSVYDGKLYWQFGVAGDYTFTRKATHQTVTVDSLTYSCNEYWILADTGQVIYKQVSTGKLGASDSAAGREEDYNTAYYNATIVTEEQSTVYTEHVTDDMLDETLATSDFGFTEYTTMRIE